MNIKTYSKEELLVMAAPYWESQDIMWATTDGQFFYSHAKSYADGHASSITGVVSMQLAKQEYLNLLKDANKDGIVSPEEELTFAQSEVERLQLKFDNAKRKDFKEKFEIELEQAKQKLDELKQK
jgi:hypothetical protein